MNATNPVLACPYTGLRSFTEEESLYFKGRDEQVDQVTALLEQNKFLMLTGASGEGKSSLIYAGLIPNARAGFFKARYPNWTVVDFRPERTPVRNMAGALAEKLAGQSSSIETELRRGFSSLIELYKNSEFYVDEKEETWKQFDEEEKKLRKRKSANLLILVDQFEEFFTNPENYHNERPSEDSQIVVNLILETAKISLQQDLPIYVVCTMRSDYIGQCAAFRGLPEYIGFSQFFVPRLKRKELKQVIEEPAILSGNKITQRLTERLVYDLAEGVDQLPILQHALTQIWHMANQGDREMDLLHYAMVGGMPANELPAEDLAQFQAWFETLQAYEKKSYSETGLNKVIEIHANRLYESAWESYNAEHPDNPIVQKQAKNIIALTFACLTKIDNSRAVRNRMTLQEITRIINRPELTTNVVGRVLNVFREAGNSFVRPFRTEDPASKELAASSVLDITHESLIRNWGMLNKWASQEFEYYNTFLDLKKQLDRWKEHGKSSDFLLPVGPLSYFENWYEKCKPNAGWINRYSESLGSSNASLEHAEDLLQDTREFLRKSARKVLVARAFMKYGAPRVASFAAIVILLVLISFYWYDANRKKNENVIAQVLKKGNIILSSKEVPDQDKSAYLMSRERYEPGTLIPFLNSIDDPKVRISQAIDMHLGFIMLDKHFNNSIKLKLIDWIKKDLASFAARGKDLDFFLAQSDKFVQQLAYDSYYNPGNEIAQTLKSQSASLYPIVLSFFKDRKLFRLGVPVNLNAAIHYWLTFGNPSREKIDSLVMLISPFHGENNSTFDVYYPKGSFEANGIRAIDFNGGFHTLASLYAAAGDAEGVIRCFELMKTQQDYFTDRVFNNYTNIIGYLYQFGFRSKAPVLIRWISTNYSSNTEANIYRDIIIRSGYISRIFRSNFKISAFTAEGNFYPNLCLGSRETYRVLIHDYINALDRIADPSERNFRLAMNFKREAMFNHKHNYDRGLPTSLESQDSLMEQAVDHFLKVDEKFLSSTVSVTYAYGVEIRTRDFSRRELFVYPDYLGGWLSHVYHSDMFFNYLKRTHRLDQVYKSVEDLNSLHYWIANGLQISMFNILRTFDSKYPLADSTLVDLLTYVDHHPAGGDFDKNLLYLVLANRAFKRGDTLSGLEFFRRFRLDNISQSANKYEKFDKTFFANQQMELACNLALIGKISESVAVTEKFNEEREKVMSYVVGATTLYNNNFDPALFILLDSVFSKSRDLDLSTLPGFIDFRPRLIYLLDKIGGEEMISHGQKIMGDVREGNKFNAIQKQVKSLAEGGHFEWAMSSIPSTLTEKQDLLCLSEILTAACREHERQTGINDWKAIDTFFSWEDYVLFFGFL